jgi:two-component system chemotaxis response regulator CheY
MAYNVLIVDDSTPMRAVIKKVVKASGFNLGGIFEASNGREALDLLEREWLDLVLTDYNMPEMDGLKLLDEMKKNESLMSIPVVMITTEGSKLRVKEFLDKGATAYIKKPFSPEEIKQKLNRIMGETSDGDEQGSPDVGDEELDF